MQNVVHYQVVKRLGGPRVWLDEPPGSTTGVVCSAEEEPVAGAVVLVSSPLGHTYTTETDADGRYDIADVMSAWLPTRSAGGRNEDGIGASGVAGGGLGVGAQRTGQNEQSGTGLQYSGCP